MTRIMIVDDNAVFAMELEEGASDLYAKATGQASGKKNARSKAGKLFKLRG